MSNETQTTVKMLSGLLAAIGLVILTAAVNSWVKDTAEQKAKVDMIFNYVITASIKDSLRDEKINRIQLEMDQHQKVTDEKISRLFESMYNAQKQLSDADSRLYLNQN